MKETTSKIFWTAAALLTIVAAILVVKFFFLPEGEAPDTTQTVIFVVLIGLSVFNVIRPLFRKK